jgi:phage gp36-like protein
MPYATQQEIEDRYGLDALTVASDRDRDGLADDDAIALALSDASAEIDSYLAVKYQLPLAVVPDVLTRCCVDISIYRLSADASVATEEQRVRYEDAMRLLLNLAVGKASLGLPVEPPTRDGAAPSVVSSERRFSRDKLRGF